MSEPNRVDFPAVPHEATRPARRRWRGRMIGILIVVVLAAVAWFAGEWLARSIVTSIIQSGVRMQLAIPAEQKVDVDIDGAIIPQLVGGRFQTVRISTGPVTVEGVGVTNAAATLHDLQISGAHEMSGGTLEMQLDGEQLKALLGAHGGLDGTLTVSDGTMTLQATGVTPIVSVPASITLTPGAAAGKLVLTPTAFSVAGASLTAEQVNARFGSLGRSLTAPREVCIADKLPRGITLAGVQTSDSLLVVQLALNGQLFSDPSLQQKGSCA